MIWECKKIKYVTVSIVSVRQVYVSWFLSRHNNDLGWRTLKPSERHSSSVLNKPCLGSWTNCVIALRQISVTALFYSGDSTRIRPWRREEWRSAPVCMVGVCGVRGRKSAGTRGRESGEHLAPPFICYFSSLWACPVQVGLSQECCWLFLQSSLGSSDLFHPSFVLFSRTFPFLVF